MRFRERATRHAPRGKILSLCVWVNWRTSGEAAPEFERVAAALRLPEVIRVVGTRWFRKANSRHAALASSLDFDELLSARGWRRSRFVGNVKLYSVACWDGAEGSGRAITFRSEVYEGAPDDEFMRPSALRFVFESIDSVSSAVAWCELVEMSRTLAAHLGGTSVIVDTGLMDEVEGRVSPEARRHVFLFAADARHNCRVLETEWRPVSDWEGARSADPAALFREFYPRGNSLDVW